MTFDEYLLARKETYDVEGDVVRLIRSKQQTMSITSVGELRVFLEDCGATTFMILAAESLWAGYLKQGGRDKTRARRSHRPLLARN